jgi:hypothetical protein
MGVPALAPRELHEPYGSSVHAWELDGTIWEPHALYGDHAGVVCMIWGHMCYLGAIWHHLRGRWCHMGAVCVS